MRSRVIHQFSLAHGAFWFLEASLAINKPKFAENLATLQREIEHTKEDFIKEHTVKYGTTDFPPAWKVLELVSFGCLTKLYFNFADTPVCKRIARSFGVAKTDALESWMKAVNDFVTELKSLFAKYPTVNPSAMGFTSGWAQEDLWK